MPDSVTLAGAYVEASAAALAIRRYVEPLASGMVPRGPRSARESV